MLTMPLADAGWAQLFRASLFYAPFAVVAGLVVEWLAFKTWLKWSWKRALLAALVVNAISCGLGVVLLPLVEMGWERQLPDALNLLSPWIRDSVAVLILWLLATILNVVLEFYPLVLLFGAKRSWRTLCVLFLANFASVFLGVLVMYPATVLLKWRN